ncbi:MAG TPA: hypothetical protein VF069_09895 [Streptosporangiaceae bacterium]
MIDTYGTTAEIIHMGFAGVATSVLAPALVVLARNVRRPWNPDRFAVPAAVAWPLFVAAHTAIMIPMGVGDPPVAADLGLHAVLMACAVLFWLPVLGLRRRLSDPGRMLYLFLAAPVLDLAGVWIVAEGNSAGGLAMIVGMLPLGVAAVATTWRWIAREERETGPGPRGAGVMFGSGEQG